MVEVTGNLVLDIMISAYILQNPGSKYIKLMQVDSSGNTFDVELTKDWWNAYDGYLQLVFTDRNGAEDRVLTKRFTPWRDTND